MEKKLTPLIIVFVFLGLAFYLKDEKNFNYVEIDGLKIPVEVVREGREIERGLGYRESLNKDSGMLFDFPYDNVQPSFWMKGMRFPIDIIWINDNIVVGVESSAPNMPQGIKDSDLQTYPAPTGIDYVLEVNAGFSEKRGIDVGDSVKLTI